MTPEKGEVSSDGEVPEKPWWISKTLWANLVAVMVILIQGFTGYVIPPEDQVIILGFLNMILRIISKTKLC